MRSLRTVALVYAALALSACHPDAIIDTDPKPSVGGTIAGIVRSGTNPVVGRSVTAINTATNARFETRTGADGGYTIKVPEGAYRIDLEIRPGETIAKRPGVTTINNSDLDSGRDFEISAG